MPTSSYLKFSDIGNSNSASLIKLCFRTITDSNGDKTHVPHNWLKSSFKEFCALLRYSSYPGSRRPSLFGAANGIPSSGNGRNTLDLTPANPIGTIIGYAQVLFSAVGSSYCSASNFNSPFASLNSINDMSAFDTAGVVTSSESVKIKFCLLFAFYSLSVLDSNGLKNLYMTGLRAAFIQNNETNYLSLTKPQKDEFLKLAFPSSATIFNAASAEKNTLNRRVAYFTRLTNQPFTETGGRIATTGTTSFFASVFNDIGITDLGVRKNILQDLALIHFPKVAQEILAEVAKLLYVYFSETSFKDLSKASIKQKLISVDYFLEMVAAGDGSGTLSLFNITNFGNLFFNYSVSRTSRDGVSPTVYKIESTNNLDLSKRNLRALDITLFGLDSTDDANIILSATEDGTSKTSNWTLTGNKDTNGLIIPAFPSSDQRANFSQLNDMFSLTNKKDSFKSCRFTAASIGADFDESFMIIVGTTRAPKPVGLIRENIIFAEDTFLLTVDQKKALLLSDAEKITQLADLIWRLRANGLSVTFTYDIFGGYIGKLANSFKSIGSRFAPIYLKNGVGFPQVEPINIGDYEHDPTYLSENPFISNAGSLFKQLRYSYIKPSIIQTTTGLTLHIEVGAFVSPEPSNLNRKLKIKPVQPDTPDPGVEYLEDRLFAVMQTVKSLTDYCPPNIYNNTTQRPLYNFPLSALRACGLLQAFGEVLRDKIATSSMDQDTQDFISNAFVVYDVDAGNFTANPILAEIPCRIEGYYKASPSTVSSSKFSSQMLLKEFMCFVQSLA